MDGAQKLILLIDDDNDLREIVSAKLQKSGFRVEEASSGQEGIDKAKNIRPDLVLLDVRMPDMTGIQTLAKMKDISELAGLKVIFLTNLGESRDENAWVDDKFSKDAGAIGHIKKTDDLNKIVERVQQVLSP